MRASDSLAIWFAIGLKVDRSHFQHLTETYLPLLQSTYRGVIITRVPNIEPTQENAHPGDPCQVVSLGPQCLQAPLGQNLEPVKGVYHLSICLLQFP